MSDAVLSNSDLVRRLVSMGGSEVLASSKAIREQEPCAQLYEEWARTGCRANTQQERACLSAIGGEQAVLCQGTYSITEAIDGWPEHSINELAAALVRRVTHMLTQPRRANITTIVSITWYHGRITLQSGASGNRLTTRNHLRRESRCHITDEQFEAVARTVLTQTGAMQLPCNATLTVPRGISVRAVRFDELRAQEWLLFSANRD